MTLMELTAILSLDSSGFNKGLAGASALAKSFTVKAIDSIGRVTKSLVKTGFEYNKEIETMQTSFKTMTGSADKAAQVMSRLKKLGAETPFETSDLAKTTQLLMQYGFTADDAISKTTMLGDIAQGNAQAMNSIATGYAQLHSAGKVNLQDIKQMINAGFNPLQEISERTGESMASLYDRISKGTISVDEITASMQYATSEGGKFFKSMENQSKTLNGQLSTIQDNWKNLTGGLVSPFTDQLQTKILPALNESIGEIADALLGVDDAADVNLPDVSEKISTWMSDLMAAWTDGIKEDDATVQGFIDSFTAITGGIKDALQGRIDALSGSDDPEAAAKIEEAKAKIAEIEAMESRVQEILSAAQGGYITEEQTAELQGYAEQLAAIETSASGLTEDVVTPWQKFADTIGSFSAEAISKVTGFITDLVTNWDENKSTVEAIAAGIGAIWLAASPGTAVLAALPAAIAMIIANWEEVKTFFDSLKTAVDDVIYKITHPGELITDAWNELVLGKHSENWGKTLDGSLVDRQNGGIALPDPEDFGLAATGTGAIATNIEAANASSAGLSTNITALKIAAEEAGASFGEIMDAVIQADGNDAVLSGLLQALIDGKTGADDLITGLNGVNTADGDITGNGVSSIGSAANAAKSNVNGLVSAVEKLYSYDGKSVNIGVNYSTSGSTGIPGRAVGIDYVPYNGYTAALHEGEMVLTRLEAERFRKNEERGLNDTSGGVGATAAEIGAAVAAALSGLGIDIDGKRAGKLLRKGSSDAQNKHNLSVARGYGY